MNFVLEAGHKNAGDVVRVYNDLKADPNYPAREALGFLSFGTKQEVPGLQAADALAYWFYRAEIENLKKDDEYFDVSELEEELYEMGMPVFGSVITPKYLMNLRTNFLRKRKKRIETNLVLDDGGPMVDPTSSYWMEH